MEAIDTKFLKKISLFEEMSEEELKAILDIIRTRKYKKGAIIFAEGEPGEAVFFVKAGRVKISKLTSDGREQILHFVSEGDVFAEVCLFNDGPYPATAEIVEDAEIGFIRNPDLEETVKNNGAIAIKLIHLLNNRLKVAQSRIRDLALKDAYARTAQLLLTLANDKGCTKTKEYTIDMDLSRQDLANMVGLTRETLTRVLSEFKKMKIININKSKIDIKNLEALRDWV